MTPQIHLSSRFVSAPSQSQFCLLGDEADRTNSPSEVGTAAAEGDGKFQKEKKKLNKVNNLGDGSKTKERRQRSEQAFLPRSRHRDLQGDETKHPGAFQTGVKQNLHAPSHAGAVEMPADATVTSSEVGINPQRLLPEVCKNTEALLDTLDNNSAKEFILNFNFKAVLCAQTCLAKITFGSIKCASSRFFFCFDLLQKWRMKINIKQ